MAFLGMRGTGDWVTDQRPKNWREQILYLYPNGMAPLTAILSKMTSSKVDDPQFHWWTENVGSVNGDVTGVYTNADHSAAYVNGGVAGDTLFIQVAEALGKQIRAGHQVLLRDTSDYTVDVVGKVTQVTLNGANTSIAVKLLEDDDNSTDHDLSDCDHLVVIGSIHSEGAEMPDPVAKDPTKWYNYTQIWRSSLGITRTARLTRLRTGDDYQKAKRECLEQHSIEMELSFLWGIRTEGVGSNGKPERTTLGLINAIRAGAADNCDDYSLNVNYAAQPWTTGGEEWLDNMLEQIFRYGSQERLAFCGSGALLGINRLAKAAGQIQLTPQSTSYGLKVMEWITPFGVIHLMTHPLFSYDATTRNMMVLFEPKNLQYRFITDTEFFDESNAKSHPVGYGSGRIDGTQEEFLTEAGLEYHHPITNGILNGVGVDSTFDTEAP